MAEMLGITKRMVNLMCQKGEIEGAKILSLFNINYRQFVVLLRCVVFGYNKLGRI